MSEPVKQGALAAVAAAFERNFRDRGELGASVSVWRHGVEVVNLGHGWCEREKRRAWTVDTLVPVYSATKGPAAATLLVALESRGLGAATPLREVWPALPVGGATFGQLLSHQCGLAALTRKVKLSDHPAVVAAVEAQPPWWEVGNGHGYHPRTFGVLVEEPVRRLTGMALGAYWRDRIAAPLGLDFWIGLPENEWGRVAHLVPGRAVATAPADGFYREFHTKSSLTWLAFHSPQGLQAVREMNEPKAWALGNPAMGGVATATALARFYQAVIGGIASPLSPQVRAWLLEPQIAGPDRVLRRDTAFTCGCQRDPVAAAWRLYGASGAGAGHSGAGGSHGFGDPATGISFGYAMNQMELSVMPGERCRRLVEALDG